MPASATATDRPFVPLRLAGKAWTTKALAVLLGTLFLAASSWIAVPMFPVPMTMQTLAVTLVGALYGWRLGLATVLAWLGEAALGLPVLANGAGGLAPFFGPTAGYLASFPIAAAFVGFVAERGWTARGRLLSSVTVMLLANLFILIFGTLVLGAILRMNLSSAYAAGFAPFIVGGILKSALATASIEGLSRSKIPS